VGAECWVFHGDGEREQGLFLQARSQQAAVAQEVVLVLGVFHHHGCQQDTPQKEISCL
jgi:hypothetical protein